MPKRRGHPKDRTDRTPRYLVAEHFHREPDQQTYDASHMGGQFEEAGYHAGRGVFGFRQET